jgi:hypothetical protein
MSDTSGITTQQKRFRVAFSFPGEQRDYVEPIAGILADRFGEEAILYDRYHTAEFARDDLGFYLPELYHDDTDLIVVVLCADYERKEWCGLEWRAIFDIMKKRRSGDVMYFRVDDAEIRGVFSTAGYVPAASFPPDQAATLILQRLALNEGKPNPSPAGVTQQRKQNPSPRLRVKPNPGLVKNVVIAAFSIAVVVLSINLYQTTMQYNQQGNDFEVKVAALRAQGITVSFTRPYNYGPGIYQATVTNVLKDKIDVSIVPGGPLANTYTQHFDASRTYVLKPGEPLTGVVYAGDTLTISVIDFGNNYAPTTWSVPLTN